MRILKSLSVLMTILSLMLFATSGIAQAASSQLHPSTRANLLTAMEGEAYAYAIYHGYAAGASQSGKRKLALLWNTTGNIEFYDHFVTEAGLYGLVGNNSDNLRTAIRAEQEAVVTYKKFAMQAQEHHCSVVATTFTEFARDEATHEALFSAALSALQGKGQVPPPPPVHPMTIHPSKPVCDAQTQANLISAAQSEAFAWAEYTLFSWQAANTGQSKLAELFAGIALVELQEHFAELANLAGLVGSNAENLRAGISAESDAIKMYSQFAQQADHVGDHAVATTFREIRSDEEGHLQSFKQALASLKS